jgi:hypothetical protein
MVMRTDTVTSLLEEIKKAVEVEVSYLFFRNRLSGGVDVKKVAHVADKVEILGYTSSPDSLEGTIRGALVSLDDPSRLVVGIQAYCPAAPSKEVLEANVQRSLGLCVQQFWFYNYGIMPMSNLTWVRDVVEMIHSVN